MSYKEAFIKIAEDCAAAGERPPQKDKPTKAQIEYDLLTGAPYTLDHATLTYAVHKAQKGADALSFDDFHRKGQPCMRASSLTKRYGWGAHYNVDGKIGIYAAGSTDYMKLSSDANKVFVAMRNKRK